MDLLKACENLAENAAEFASSVGEQVHVSETDIRRWQRLFKLTRNDAVEEITNWRNNLGREYLSQAAWSIIRESRMSEGFDKESYEYSVCYKKKTPPTSTPSGNGDTGMYLLRLHDALPTIQTVKVLLNSEKAPQVLSGSDDDGSLVQFCYLTPAQKDALVTALGSSTTMHFTPSFVRISIASKNLLSDSKYPTIGIDSLSPQHRPQHRGQRVFPGQNEYPVCYFFYGTLATPAVLARVLGRPAQTDFGLRPARVFGARLTTWADKYLGLKDGGASDSVRGHAYMVMSEEDEEALRIYETSKYEVARCGIHLQSENTEVQGLTFRLK